MSQTDTEGTAKGLQAWHEIASAGDATRLGEVLAEDCVFFSPVVHTPQVGREISSLYLAGAMQVFNESFHYTKEIVSRRHAVLEFECMLDDILINGVDIISFNEDGKIAEFRVMLRPLQAVNLLHSKMQAALESFGK